MLASYPLRDGALQPAWRNRRSQILAAAAVAAAVLAIVLRSPFALSEIDDVTLRIVFPTALAFVLAFAPTPGTRVGRTARDLTVLGLCLAVFAGDLLPVMLASYPLVLMISVLIDWVRPARGSSA
ncbi:MAG TPA: hypothetical protein VMF90_13525 [Rhizobiaceae bacterium]|nr:hypothetical protein [Rhizobiaceae bacterium]